MQTEKVWCKVSELTKATDEEAKEELSPEAYKYLKNVGSRAVASEQMSEIMGFAFCPYRGHEIFRR